MQVSERDDVVVVSLSGDDVVSLWRELEPLVVRGRKAVVIDLARISFLNSVSIAAIITTRNKLVAAGARVGIANLKESIKAVFRILKLDRLFDLNLDLDGAVAKVR